MKEERTTVRVRYPEVDQMGIAHHSQYLLWFEQGRTELMRSAGVPYGELEAQGILFPVLELGARFRASARYDELIEVRTRLAQIDRLRVRFEYDIVGEGDQRPLTEGFTLHAAITREGRLRRIPKDLLETLELWKTP